MLKGVALGVGTGALELDEDDCVRGIADGKAPTGLAAVLDDDAP